MSETSWKKKGDEIKKSPQKYKWSKIKVFDTYEGAVSHKSTLKCGRPVKINRCGVAGSKFVVKVGVELKSNIVAKSE